ncbi:unnamed protein product, partial [Mesorhabditis belari]|uniref:Uncharacterized protein n=1 Tax=Mesorhabditis belari TaxID=2138241 RepID=A0AAF3FF30_9BILA
MTERNHCAIAVQLNDSTVYTMLNTVHLITCVLSIVLAFRLQNAWHSRVYFHANVKMLLTTMLCLAVVHAITMSSFLFLNLFSWLFADDSCDSLMFNGTMCLFLRHPTNVCIAGLVLCQLSIAVERVVATWIGPEYNTYSNKIGRILSVSTIVCSIVLLGPLLASETTEEKQINCGFPSSAAATHNWMLMLELLAIDVLSVLVFLIVYGVSKYMKTGAMFQLERRYQINETLYVTKLLLPVTFVHFLLFAILCSAIIFIEMIFEDAFTIIYYEVIFYTAPFYTVLFPLIILHVIKQLDQNRKEKITVLVSEEVSGQPGTRAHFESLDRMWGCSTPVKGGSPRPTPV